MKKAVFLSILFLISFTFFKCSFEKDDTVTYSEDTVSESHYANLWDSFYLHLDANKIDSALYYSELIKAISTKEGNKKWLAKSNKAIGFIFGKQGMIKESTSFYLLAAEGFSETGEIKELAGIYINLGSEFHDYQDYFTAIYYYNKAKEIYHYEGSSQEKAVSFRGLALCYKKLNEYKKAEDFLLLGKKAAEAGRDFYNLGLIYNTWGFIKLDQQDYDQAYDKFLLTLQYSDSTAGTTELKAIASHNIGEIFFIGGDHTKAKDWATKALLEKNKLQNPILAQSSFLLLAKILIKENKYNEAITLLEVGLQKVGTGTVHPSINESLTLINEALVNVNKKATTAEYPELNKKLITYSQQLLAYNHNVSETKERLETISRQQSIQEALEQHAYNEQLAKYEERNTYMQYAFLIPVFFLLCALVSIYLSMRRNKEYKKLYSKIEETISAGKGLRHLKKK